MDAGGLIPNTWQRFERLGSLWEQAKVGLGDESRSAVEYEPGAVVGDEHFTGKPVGLGFLVTAEPIFPLIRQ